MKVSIDRESLNKALGAVGRMVSQKSTLPILSNLLLLTDKGRLRLSATNLESGIHYWVGAKIEKEGSTTVPARVFTEFLASLSEGEMVNLNLVEDSLQVECLENKANLATISANEFPKIPLLEQPPTLEMSTKDFAKGVSQVSFAASFDEGRPLLTGVLIKIGKTETEFVATDGYRLAKKVVKTPSNLEVQVIISARTLQEVLRVCTDEESLGITLIDNQVLFNVGMAQLSARILDGSYPNYEQIIPKTTVTSVSINRTKLSAALKTASTFARDIGNVVQLDFSSGKLILSASTSQVGDSKSSLEVKLEGEPLKASYNSKYLTELLGVLDGENLVFASAGALNPAVIKGEGEESFLSLVMPVRMQN